MIKLVTILVVVVAVLGDDCDPKKCAPIPKHYEELGCTPVKAEGKCCPTKFDCPKITDLAGDKCYFNKDVLNIGDRLDGEKTSALCAAGCFCEKEGKYAKFTCANIECPDLFQPYDPKCVKQYKINDCCPYNRICEDEKKTDLHKCDFEGKSYYEGERMYPKTDTCYHCLCSKDFEDKPAPENSNCQKVNCGIELRYAGRFRSGCIPIYYGNESCCPIGWRCPEDEDKVVADSARSGEVSEVQCNFGKLKMNIGDSLNQDDKKVTCKCTTPPFAHCIQEKN